MPLLTRSNHPPHPVMTGHGEDGQEIGDEAAVKKQVVEEVGRVRLCNNQIHSGAEKTVVRKLDRRILTLLVILCPFPSSHPLPPDETKLPTSRSSFYPGSFQHWV